MSSFLTNAVDNLKYATVSSTLAFGVGYGITWLGYSTFKILPWSAGTASAIARLISYVTFPIFTIFFSRSVENEIIGYILNWISSNFIASEISKRAFGANIAPWQLVVLQAATVGTLILGGAVLFKIWN